MKAHDRHDLDALDANLLTIEREVGVARRRVVALRQTEVTTVAVTQGPTRKPLKANPHGLFVEIHETDTIAGAFSSWFRLGKVNPKYGEQGIVGADHSEDAWGDDRSTWPEWTQKYDDADIIERPGGLDIIFFGVVIPDAGDLPPDLKRGDRIAILGYPAGVTVPDHFEVRIGTADFERDEDGIISWIIMFDNGQRLAMGGMSGGVVLLLRPDQIEIAGDEIAVAVLITQNTRLNGLHSSDVTELRDALRAGWRVAHADIGTMKTAVA